MSGSNPPGVIGPIAVSDHTHDPVTGHTLITYTTGVIVDHGLPNKRGDIQTTWFSVAGGVQATQMGDGLGYLDGTTTTPPTTYVASITPLLPPNPAEGNTVRLGGNVAIGNITVMDAEQTYVVRQTPAGYVTQPLQMSVFTFHNGLWRVMSSPEQLPVAATADVAGIVKIGANVNVTSDGTISVAAPGTGQTGATGAQGIQGVAGTTGAAGATGIVPTYGTAGLIAGVKSVQIAVTSTAGGVWSVLFNAATFPGFTGFASPPIVEAHAISTSGLISGLNYAQMQSPTAAGVSGTVTTGGVSVLGAAGVMVHLRATGA